jgi:beta-lactamase regulating signal transducer with metallopeptidase domain
MNPSDWNPLYVTLAGLGLVGVIVVALAELASRRASRAQFQRAIWLSAATLLVSVTLAEWFGARAAMEPVWTAAKKPVAEAQPQLALQPDISTKSQPVAPRITEAPVRLTVKPLVEVTAAADRAAGWLAIVWIGGTGLLLARCSLALGLLPLVRRRFGPVDDAELLSLAKEVRERLRMKRTPELRQGTVASPMTFGLLRPVVCLPADFAEAFPAAQQRAVLAHEFAHVAALDAVWRCLGEVLTALLWWHPAVWLVRRRLHSACEIAADEASRLTGPVSGHLAEALVALAGKTGPVAPWPMLAAAGDGYHSDLGQRVERLLESSDGRTGLPNAGWRWSAAAMFAAVVLLFGLSACHTGGESPAKQVGKALQRDEPAIAEKEEVKPKDTNLVTRVFMVEPRSFVAHLGAVTRERLTNSTEATKGAGTEPSQVQEMLRRYFAAAGLDLTPPKEIFFNDQNGLLKVRASTADLELVQGAIGVLSVAPSQITIESKWIEVTDEGMNALAKEWPVLSSHPVGPGALKPGPSLPDWPGLQKTNKNFRIETNVAQSATVLTAPQTFRLLKSLEGLKGVDILASPKVTTLSGRQAQVSVQEMKTVVSGIIATNGANGLIGYQTRSLPFGPVLDIVPDVRADGFTIGLTVLGTVSEFLGYDDPGGFVPQVAQLGSEPTKATLPLPRIRTLSLQASAIVWDGQSLLLGGLTTTTTNTIHGRVKADGTIEPDTDTGVTAVGDKKPAEAGGVYSVNATGYVTTTTTKHLFVLITPTLIDPAGNRIHGE